MVTLLVFLILFGVIIFVHELGHFGVAKLAGVNVEEFGLGYPPRLFSLGTWKGTQYTINAIPIGGFVKMGEGDLDDPDSMANRPGYIRAAAFLAGPLMNLLLAVLCYALISLIGQQYYVGRVVIDEVASGSPAMAAGLQVGDVILAANGEPVRNSLEISQATKLAAGTQVQLLVERDGEQLSIALVPRINPPPPEGAMGIRITTVDLETVTLRYSATEAIPAALERTRETIGLIFASFAGMFRGAIAPELTGPVGLVQVTGQVAKSGLANLLDLAALVSINLFILNLLPFPPLDGFRILLIVVEAIRGGRRFELKTETAINAIGMVILLGLMLLVTVRDVIRVASGQSLIP